MPTDDRIYTFGPFTLEVTARLLSNSGNPVAVGSRAFEILVALVERRGEVISKQDLLARVWPNLHVEEHNLKAHVSALRRALGEEGRKLLINVPGRGYSFVGPVTLNEKSPRAADSEFGQGAGSSLRRHLAKEPPKISDNSAAKASTSTVKIGIVHSLT